MSGTLSYEDIKDTQLAYLIDNTENEISEKLQGLLELPDEPHSAFYCYKDNDELIFFENEFQIADKLSKTYPVDTKWEELDNIQLQEYLSRIKHETCEVPFVTFE